MSAKERDATSGARTIREMARVLGCDESLVRRRRDQGSWPAGVSTTPPWTPDDIEAVRAYLAALRAARRAGGSRQEALRLVRAKRRKTEVETTILRGQYMSRGEVERGWSRRVDAVRRGLRMLARALKSRLPGHTPPTMELIVDEEVFKLLNHFAGRRSS